MSFSAIIRRLGVSLLFIALIFGATVPKGMMRYADSEGIRLVLCTTDGPREMVLAPDGTLEDIPLGKHEEGGALPCLAVVLSFAGVQSGAVAAPALTIEAVINPVRLADIASPAPARGFASRAPPLPA